MKGDIENAVYEAIQASLRTYDIVAELYTNEVVRDRKRQRGTREGGSKTPEHSKILDDIINEIITKHQIVKAGEAWGLIKKRSDSGYNYGKFIAYIDSESTKDEVHIVKSKDVDNSKSKKFSKKTFVNHFSRIKNGPVTKSV